MLSKYSHIYILMVNLNPIIKGAVTKVNRGVLEGRIWMVVGLGIKVGQHWTSRYGVYK